MVLSSIKSTYPSLFNLNEPAFMLVLRFQKVILLNIT